uniref:Putative secreted protein n=1 Tax=Anopheles marajoara TaxID=58244 RepID=A0A2M4C634_9DIPT
MHPSFSGLLVTCAYFPHTTLPDCVTRPSSEMFTSITVPLVITPRLVYIGDDGFFFTPIIGRWKVAFSSGCVTCALLNRSAIGRMKRSYLGGLRVKFSPTYVTLVTIRFQAFRRVLPLRITLNTSASDWARTFGIGTSHLPAFSFRFCLIILDSTLALDWMPRSIR